MKKYGRQAIGLIIVLALASPLAVLADESNTGGLGAAGTSSIISVEPSDDGQNSTGSSNTVTNTETNADTGPGTETTVINTSGGSNDTDTADVEAEAGAGIIRSGNGKAKAWGVLKKAIGVQTGKEAKTAYASITAATIQEDALETEIAALEKQYETAAQMSNAALMQTLQAKITETKQKLTAVQMQRALIDETTQMNDQNANASMPSAGTGTFCY